MQESNSRGSGTDDDLYKPIEVTALPYLNLAALGGRPVPICSFHDGERWHLWVPTPDQRKLQPLRTEGLIEGSYLAREPVDSTDLCFALVNFFEKRVSAPRTSGVLNAIQSDVFNIAASLHKLELITRACADDPHASRLALTEIEYLVVIMKSVFDLVQKLIRRLWQSVKFTNGYAVRVLPETFSKIALEEGKRPRHAQATVQKFGISTALAEWYERNAAFFLHLRSARDAVVHHAKPDEVIFCDQRGFRVRAREGVFRRHVAWDRCELADNDIGPLNYAIGSWIGATFAAIEQLPSAVEQQIQPLPDFAPDYRIFLRSPYLRTLTALEHVLKHDPWARFQLEAGI